MYLPTRKSSLTLRISSWNGVKSLQLEVIFEESRDDQALHQPHQLIARLEAAIGLIVELQIRDAARVVRIGDRVHAPDAVEIRRRRDAPAAYSAA